MDGRKGQAFFLPDNPDNPDNPALLHRPVGLDGLQCRAWPNR